MRVQRVVMRESGEQSWTLLGEDHGVVEPVERFWSYLASIEKSPNTIKAYAHDLKDWFTYLAGHGLDWRVRGVAAAPAGGPCWEGRGAAECGAVLRGVQREPQARGVDLVL
jgi:hypothetical protein